MFSDAPKVGYTTYLDWWFYPIFYYTCFALYEFMFVQVNTKNTKTMITMNAMITTKTNIPMILFYSQSLIGQKREALAKNVEFFSRVLANIPYLQTLPFLPCPPHPICARSSSLSSPSSTSSSTPAW